MNIIVAVDEAWGIGCEGKLLASVPEDMRFFKETTQGKTVVMGRATLESLPGGRPLTNRRNIVMSRSASQIDGAEVCANTAQLFETLGGNDSGEVFVIGGEMVYRLLLPHCKKAYVTKLFDTFPADKFMPNMDEMPEWVVVDSSEIKEHDGISYQFVVYKNKNVD